MAALAMSSAPPALSAAEAMVRIRMAMQNRDIASARAIAEQGRRDHPRDAALADAAGDLALKSGDALAAVDHFAAACTLAPSATTWSGSSAV